MGKPWARIEIGYLNHPKFLALNAHAICLWIEGKNYCDTHHTDGLIPKDALQTFRFRRGKSIMDLMTSCGAKSDGTTYAPLWEVHAVGYRMHDYLAYNDCRDEVMQRIEDAEDVAELRKIGNRERQATYRADRKAKLAGSLPVTGKPVTVTRDSTRDVTRDTLTPTETETPTETDPQKMKEPSSEGGSAPPALRPRPMAPIHDTSHRKHAVCGRVCLHASLFNDFVRRRNHGDADREIRTWAEGVVDEWTTGLFQAIEPGDSFDFWKARYAEQWPAATAAAPSKLPPWVQKARANV